MTLSVKEGGILAATEQLARMVGVRYVHVYFSSSESRSGAENREIADKQVDLGRDPWFLGRTQTAAVKKIMDGAIKEIVASGTTTRLDGALSTVGRFIVGAFQENIQKGRSRGGKRLRGNLPAYRKVKAKRFGSDVRPLVASGQLRDSLAYKVAR